MISETRIQFRHVELGMLYLPKSVAMVRKNPAGNPLLFALQLVQEGLWCFSCVCWMATSNIWFIWSSIGLLASYRNPFSPTATAVWKWCTVLHGPPARVKWLEPGFLSIFVLDCVPCQRREYGSWPGLACIYRHRHWPWEEIASVFRTLILKYRSHFWKAMGAGIKYDGFPMVSLMVSPMVSMFAGENRP